MASTEKVGVAKGAHLVGGLRAPDAETAMRTAGALLGRHLYAITDGETGERSQWIWWQLGKRDLQPGRRLALDVIDYEGDEQRTKELVEAAATGAGGVEFAVATECGMARIDERGPDGPSLERLLELHARFAAPLR